MPVYKWIAQTDDEKIEDIRKYFLEPKIVKVTNLLKLTKNHIKQCEVEIGELQEIRNLEKIVVAETKIEEIKEKIKAVQRAIKNAKAKKRYKNKKLKRLLEDEWQKKESYLTEEEVLCYIKYGRIGNKK